MRRSRGRLLRDACVLALVEVWTGHALADPRIREVPFDAASVVTVPVKLGVTAMVQFAQAEHVKTVAAGQGADCAQVTDSWCVSWPAEASFLFVRPKSRAHYPLSLAVVTDRHAYSLVFDPAPAGRVVPVHRLTFTYATSRTATPAQENAATPVPGKVASPKTMAPTPVNPDYTIAFGERSLELAPSLVFDDGRFTYLKWPGNREVPAVFEIRADGSEVVVNTRMQGDFIVVDRVAHGLMLRAGSAVAALRNENFDEEGTPPVHGTTAVGLERAMKDLP